MLGNLIVPDLPFLPDPINRQHPANRWLAGWFLTLPGLDGGPTWYDLFGSSPGVLNGLTAAGSGWSGTTRPGGWGQMNFDGSGHRIDVAGGAFSFASGSFTVCLWVKTSVKGTSIIGTYNGGGWGLATTPTGTTDWFFYGSGGNVDPYPTGNGAGDIADGQWHRVTAVYFRDPSGTGLTITAYIDGAQTGSQNNAANASITGGALQIGTYNGGAGSLVGAVDDVRVYNRALNATEVWSDYDLSRRGYPVALNRPKPVVRSLPAAAFNPAWAIGANRLVGCGVN